MFSTETHQALGRIEKMVDKFKKYLNRSRIWNQFKNAHFTRSELSTIVASIVTTLNTHPLAVFKNEILSPQTFHYHNFTMTPSTDSILPIMRSTTESIEQQINDAIIDSKEDKIDNFQTFKII